MEQRRNEIILTEENILDVYKKLHNNGNNLSQEELSKVKDRFKFLVNHENHNGTKM